MMFRTFVAGCVVTLVIIALFVGFVVMTEITTGPKTVMSKITVASHEDARRAAQIIDAGIAREIPCGAWINKAFDVYGKPRVWVTKPVGTGEFPWKCYDSPASDRQRGEGFPALQPITAEIVAVMVDRPAYYPKYLEGQYTVPPPAPYVPPTPPPTPPPIQNRDLGDRRCCPQ